jgi:outer membrane protein OmpA-like peptidoglycan-associated protein
MAAEKHQIQRKADNDSEVTFAREVAQPSNPDSATLGSANPQQLSEALSNSGSGTSLDGGAREFLEPKFGHSFENVKIHADGRADELSKSVNARAFTTGQDVYFREGEYKPNSPEGRHLLAHELTHTIQQSRGTVSGTSIGGGVAISEPGDSFEQEASSAADTVARGGQVAVGGSTGMAVQRMPASGLVLQRDTPTPAPAVTPTTMPAPAAGGTFEQNLAAADVFHGHGMFGPTEVQPGGGAFEASYDPAAGVLNIVMRAAVNFQDALTSSGGSFTPANANLQSLANRARTLTPAKRAAFLARYQWNAAEKTGWLTNLETSVESAWGGKHQFHINKPQWEWIGAQVNVDVQAHDGARAGNDHLAVDAIKMPPGENLYSHNDAGEHPDPATPTDHTVHSGFSSTGTGSSTNSFDSTMTIASTDVTARPDNVLRNFVLFDHNSDALRPGVAGGLQDWIATFQGAPGTPGSRSIGVKLEAHTSASGTAEYNVDLAQRRADTIKTFLGSHGLTNVSGSIITDPQGVDAGASTRDSAAKQERQRRVDLIVDSGASQVLAAHEFGHAFGLGDEYSTAPAAGTAGTSTITGSGGTSGTPADHDGLTKNMTDASGTHLPGAVHENNDNIMSFGNTVQPQHYSTFHAALQQISGVNEWALGAPTARPTAPASTGTPAPAPAATPATPPPPPPTP